MPGLVDFNVRTNGEWCGTEHATKAALAGGVTLICSEDSFYDLQETHGKLFCDVGRIARVHSAEDSNKVDCALGIKTYLTPQHCTMRPLSEFSEVISCLGTRPLIVDPSFCSPRFLHVASPYRRETLEHRTASCRLNPVGDYNWSVDLSIDVERSPLGNFEKENQSEQIVKSPDPDFGKRSANIRKSLQELTKAELETYSHAGQTDFSAPSQNFRSASFEPSTSNLASRRIRSPVLRPLQIRRSTYDETSYRNYLVNVPYTWEVSGIQKTLDSVSGVPVHFCNVSSPEAITKILEAKQANPNITFDLSPHSIFFSEKNVKPGDTRFKNCPPIQFIHNQEQLKNCLESGVADIVTSQNNPVHPAYKVHEFRRAVSGIESLGHTLRAVWTALSKGSSEHYIVKLADWMSHNPAKLLGLSKRGGICQGKFADFFVWKPFEWEFEKCHSKYPETCVYQDLEMKGKVEKVFLKGNLVYDSGVMKDKGNYVLN
mgnify:FL=1